MDKVYKLSETIADDFDYIRVNNFYSKESGGYEVMTSPINVNNYDGVVLYSQPIWGTKIDFKLVVPCGRRSKKREEEANKIVSENAEEFVRNYLDDIGKKEVSFELYE